MAEGERNFHPLDDGRSVLDDDTLAITWMSPIGQDMVDLGYKMVSAEVDESGYFLTVQFENIKLNHVRHLGSGVPLCRDNTDGFVVLDRDNENRQCPKCHRLVKERPSS